MAKKPTENYSAKDIQTLEFPDTVRKNVGMYVGGSNARGSFQCVYEIISNGVDEYLADHCSELYVKIDTKENHVIICDNGRGMPIDKHPKTKEPAIYLIFGSLHAGGKMAGSSAYVSSGGMHGVGAAASNALAGKLVAQTFKNGKWHSLEYNSGILKQKLKAIDTKDRLVKAFSKGTQILWSPDKEIFKAKEAFKISVSTIEEQLSDLSYLCSGLKIHFDVDGKVTTFFQEKGAYQFTLDAYDVTFEEGAEVQKLHSKPYHYASKDLDVSLLWSTDQEEHIYAYTNCIRNPGHGTHVISLKDTVHKVFQKVFPDKKYNKNALFQGLVGLVSVRLTTRPEYEGQTKDKLTSEEAKKIVEQFSGDFEKWVRNNGFAEKIVNFAVQRGKAAAKMNQELAAQAKELANEVKEANKRKFVVCDKLEDAYDVKPEEREIYLVEGDSAGGTLLQARDDSYQAVLLLKGKFSNAYKDKPRSIFQNEDVKNIFTSMGIAPGQGVDKAKVKRLLIMADPDVDGRHISCLALGLIMQFMPELITEKEVLVVMAPLYIITDSKGKKHYAMNDRERDAVLKKISGKPRITRMKGWGEADPEFVKEFAMDPKTRVVKRIKFSDKSADLVQRIMGDDVQYRKKMLNIDIREMLEVQ